MTKGVGFDKFWDDGGGESNFPNGPLYLHY